MPASCCTSFCHKRGGVFLFLDCSPALNNERARFDGRINYTPTPAPPNPLTSDAAWAQRPLNNCRRASRCPIARWFVADLFTRGGVGGMEDAAAAATRDAQREANRIHCRQTRERKRKKEQLLREVCMMLVFSSLIKVGHFYSLQSTQEHHEGLIILCTSRDTKFLQVPPTASLIHLRQSLVCQCLVRASFCLALHRLTSSLVRMYSSIPTDDAERGRRGTACP